MEDFLRTLHWKGRGININGEYVLSHAICGQYCHHGRDTATGCEKPMFKPSSVQLERSVSSRGL